MNAAYKDKIVGFFFLITFFLFNLMAAPAYAVVKLNYPHWKGNFINCKSCHLGTVSTPWSEHIPQNIDDTKTNNICWSCHNDIDAIYVGTHSSLQTDNGYGNWSVQCLVCHYKHQAKQFSFWGSASYLYQGISTEITANTLTMTGAGWSDDVYAGKILHPNLAEPNYSYKIVGNTTDTLTVQGPMYLEGVVSPGDTFIIKYDKLIRTTINLKDITDPLSLKYDPSNPATYYKRVRFFNATGPKSFADGDTTYDGVCEVCHTETTHYRNDGSGSDPLHANMGYPAGSNCTFCHSHKGGFRGMGKGAHTSHVIDQNGPLSNCFDCHENGNIPFFKSGTDSNGDGKYNLAETDVCNNCHSADGIIAAKSYWLGAPGTWVAAEGEQSFCGSCHNATPSNSGQNGTGDDAPNIMGDNTLYGYFVTGHGKTSGNYAKLSWQDTSATGNPAANLACSACHDLTSRHFNNATMRLKPGYENDMANSNCKQCHDPGSVATGNPAWYTTYAAYQNSAHKNEKCTNCHDVHGASGSTPAMTTANQETLCYECHTDGMVKNFGVSGYTGRHDGGDNQTVMINSTANFPTLNVNLVGWKIFNKTDGSIGTITSHDATQITAMLSGGTENDWDDNDEYHIAAVDDIQEAFSQGEKHNLGISFSVGGKNYSLECISCHNVHLVTGKHWDAEQGLSPITRFTDNLKVWGDDPGEKTDDFAARASGSGGFYYKTAQGYSLGATGLPFDQPAKYQPPKNGKGYDLEFGGDVLPDYTTFCLDCHSSQMAESVGAINWGQGISGGFPEPPGPGYANWVNTNAPHGLNSANMPFYVSDGGASGAWGSSGNPDVLFDMNSVSRGRHNGHFMRWPYDSADRGAGVNFVMACTDCHEAHGANGPSMLRPVVNNSTPGSGTWNTFCSSCHYYYGGQHAGMSCATASCHEGYSIHRIKKNGGSGSTQLMLTSAGHEGDFVKPDFTPEIEMVSGRIGSNDLVVTFRESQYGSGFSGVYANSDLTGNLTKNDFWLFDKNGNNEGRTITSVSHTAGSTTATLTLSEPLDSSDLFTDTLAMKSASVWGWYEGGYNNAATGTIPAHTVSAGPWPITITELPSFNIQSVLYGSLRLPLNGIVEDSNQIYVVFDEGAYSSNDGELQVGDVDLECGGRMISSVTHIAGDSFAILTLDTIIDQSEIGVCTVSAAPGSIFDSSGNPAETAPVTLALPPEAFVDDLVLRWDFNENSGVVESNGALGTQEDMRGMLTRNVVRVTSTKPGTAAGDKAVKFDRVSDRGAVQLNYTVNPDDGFPPATYRSGGAPVIVQEMQQTSEFSFSAWIKPDVLGCQEGKDLGLNNKLRRDVLTSQFWIKNWAIGIMRFSDDGDPINGNCTVEDSTHDVLRFWVAVGDPDDMRCDAWGGSWPEYVHPVSPAGYIQGTTLMPTDQAVCDNSATPILPTNTQAHSFAQTETSASGASTYGVVLKPGVWQHVVGTWNGRYIRIYIDGQLAAETDMGGTGNYVMVDDPHLWGGDLVGDGSVYRHVSSFFAAGARPIFSTSGVPSGGSKYWNSNGFYDLNSFTYVGELDDVKYWKVALPLKYLTGPVDGTTAGTATAIAVGDTSIALSMPYTDDANSNNSYTVDYKLSSEPTNWFNWVTEATNTASPYATTIAGLTASEIYDVRMTYNDADGVLGTTEQIVSGIDLTPYVDLTTASQSVAEDVGTVTITATLSIISGSDITVPFTVSGTATSGGTDHNLVDGSIIVTAGQLTGTTNFTVADDYLNESDETVIVTMGTPVNAIAGATDVHTVTITDNDVAIPSVTFTSVTQSTADESGTAIITLQLSAVSSLNVTVPFTVNGSSTATGGTDYSITASPLTITAGNITADIIVTIESDSDVEGGETVIVDMGIPINATLGATTTHTLTITDDDSAAGSTVMVCVSPVGNFTTIQAAIDDSGTIDGMTVFVCEGTYSENINYGSKKITLKAEGSVANTIIEGTSGNNAAVVTFNNPALDNSAVLDGFTIDNQASNVSSRGIYITGAAMPKIINSTIRGNTPATWQTGAGIYIDQGGMTLENCTVGGLASGNIGGPGAGIYAKTTIGGPYAILISTSSVSYNSGSNGGGAYFDTSFNGTVNIFNSTISNNSGSSRYGAGIYSAIGLILTNTNITDNYDTNTYLKGGGLYLTGTDKTTTFTGGLISGNIAANGGGIHIAGGADLIVEDGALISGNIVDVFFGGGVRIVGPGSSLTCSKASFIGNSTRRYGGAIYNNSGSVSLTNCNVTGNTANYYSYSRGGGIYTTNTSGTATVNIYNSTIAGNYAYYGGGGLYHNGGITSVTNSIFWDNAADSISPEIYGTITVTYSDVEGGITGTGNINQDPTFVTPAQAGRDFSTTAGDFHVQPGSNVIDQGTATDAPADDIDGDLRPQGAGIDMGADELFE